MLSLRLLFSCIPRCSKIVSNHKWRICGALWRVALEFVLGTWALMRLEASCIYITDHYIVIIIIYRYDCVCIYIYIYINIMLLLYTYIYIYMYCEKFVQTWSCCMQKRKCQPSLRKKWHDTLRPWLRLWPGWNKIRQTWGDAAVLVLGKPHPSIGWGFRSTT